MHDVTVTRDLAAKVLQAGEGADAITTVNIHIGESSHLCEERIRALLALLLSGSNGERAAILISRRADLGHDVWLESIEVAG